MGAGERGASGGEESREKMREVEEKKTAKGGRFIVDVEADC